MVESELIIDIARLDQEGEHLQGELLAAALDLTCGDGLLEPASNVNYDLRVQAIGSELLVQGSINMELTCVCSRCNVPFKEQVEEQEHFTAHSLAENPEFVDLTPELREAMILTFPLYPVCGEECCGLCPYCGANLNHGRCSCKPEAGDSRWSALDALLPEK